MRRTLRNPWWVTIVIAGTTACSAPASDPPAPAEIAGWPVHPIFDYQLGGAYPPPADTTLVVRDGTAAPAPGRYSICYINGFQTQPDDRHGWPRQHGDLLLTDTGGRLLTDPQWPDEYVLDTSTDDKRTRLAELLTPAVESCARKGFRAVELDNLDSYTRSHGILTATDNLALAAALIRLVHDRGMAAGQKNAADLSSRAARTGFDFAVAEECAHFTECESYTDVYGDHVLDIEYTDTPHDIFDSVCRAPGTPRATILRDRPLVAIGEPGYAYRHC